MKLSEVIAAALLIGALLLLGVALDVILFNLLRAMFPVFMPTELPTI